MKRVSKSVGPTPNKVSEILQIVRSALETHRLLDYADHVVIGLSGGPDSMALLHLLIALRHELGIKISVAHFNHRIRRQAARDEQFVKDYAKKMGVPVFCESASTQPPSCGSLEDWARQERYKFFKRVAQKADADAIALGHTADDLAETVLMRIIRGSGLQGLVGMEYKRTINDVLILRPLLGVEKRSVYEYLQALNVPYCIDTTNSKTDFFRNKIRLELLPRLVKEYNPHMMQALVTLSNTSSADYSFLMTHASAIWDEHVNFKSAAVCMNVSSARQWHPAMRRIIIRMAYERVKGDLNQLTFDHVTSVENLIFAEIAFVQLPAHVAVEKRKQMVLFFKKN
ncbi:MAG: tRNA lysidine(34) synthetase TilS [Candidatus Omnitrophica bacterium]|nr:tRNA lysidine(34) synthetase TilS [Candidatus Omnitrophota bacterium]